MGDCRNDLDIFAALAERLGIEGYNDRGEDEWLRDFCTGAVDDYDQVVAIKRVAPGSPADAAGIVAGDVLRVANGRLCFGQTDFRGVLHDKLSGPRRQGGQRHIWH